ncbi:hypothetical protein [Roseovarius salinarum]|uniref:hypothetical protein n=1 Tax=Roseovarius salinarum TaxID=1981892 RepID=UPI000C32A5CE|nr:hypothetical protein [Roseovarius salinarum]
MTGRTDDIIARIRALEAQLESEFAARREAFRYRLENGRVVFEEEARRRHRELRTRFLTFVRRTRPMTVVTAPVIYALVVPIAALHLSVWVYQAICFPVYGIPRVPHAPYLRVDRHRLAYLNGVQKLNCVYCGYANGVIAWVREVASRTEGFWCPIKHATHVAGTHERYPKFLDYGDAEGFHEGLEAWRRHLARGGGTDATR